MAGHSPGMIKSYTAGGAIGARRIIKFGAADSAVLVGAAATDKSIGISTDIDAASGERVDVIRSGLAEVVYGGTVTRGDQLTSDASGAAVSATPSAGSNVRIIGIAEVSGVSGDIGVVHVVPSMLQG